MAGKFKGLGRGLGALINDASPDADTSAVSAPPSVSVVSPPVPPVEPTAGRVIRVSIAKIHRSPWQPRRMFKPEKLDELAASIRERGVLSPLLVRVSSNGTYELIAGERRFRAAQIAEQAELPVIVMDGSDRDVLEMALVENLQREDLNLVEEAEGYRLLMDKFSLTQEQVAQRVGKGRPTVANALRLLSLPDSVKSQLAEGRVSPGHAKVLLSLTFPADQEALAARVVAEQMSVRTLERVVARMQKAPRKPRAQKEDIPASHVQYLVDKLHQHLGTSLRVTPSRTLSNGKKVKGVIEIDFYSNDDLERLLAMMGLTDLGM